MTAPSEVNGLSVTKSMRNGTFTLNVSWSTPQSDVTISQYEVQYRGNETTVWDSAVTPSGSPPPNSTLLTELDAGTEYHVRVRAISEIGAGRWSVLQTVKTDDSEYSCSVSCHHSVSSAFKFYLTLFHPESLSRDCHAWLYSMIVGWL